MVPTTAVSYFSRYFTDEFCNLLVKTNQYSFDNLHMHLASQILMHGAMSCSVDKMKVFIGITILMGIVHLPRLYMYVLANQSLYTVWLCFPNYYCIC